jgi:hypothetical protein
MVYAITDFVHSPVYDAIIDALRPSGAASVSPPTKLRAGA